MKIRPAQIQTLDQHAQKAFEQRVLAYLEEKFPVKCAAMGSEKLGAMTAFGRYRAASRQCYSERSIVMFLHLMFMLGAYFDSDPMLPWAGEILSDPALADEHQRMNALWGKAADYCAAVLGPDDEHLERALHRVREGESSDAGHEPEAVLQDWMALFPEKMNYMGAEAARAAVDAGAKKAEYYGLNATAGKHLYLTLAYLLGSGFDCDPQYEWAGAALRDGSIATPVARTERLRSEAMAHLELFLDGREKLAEASHAA